MFTAMMRPSSPVWHKNIWSFKPKEGLVSVAAGMVETFFELVSAIDNECIEEAFLGMMKGPKEMRLLYHPHLLRHLSEFQRPKNCVIEKKETRLRFLLMIYMLY